MASTVNVQGKSYMFSYTCRPAYKYMKMLFHQEVEIQLNLRGIYDVEMGNIHKLSFTIIIEGFTNEVMWPEVNIVYM